MRRWAALLVPGLAAAALYVPTLSYQRTFDDAYQIPAPGKPPAHGIATVWSRPYWGPASQGGLYRPVISTLYWVEGRIDLPLAARHGVNVLLHVAVTVLVVRLALSLGLGLWPAAMAGILFALHPVHVEAVAGLVGGAELLAGLGLLLLLWLHDRLLAPRSGESPRTRWTASEGAAVWLGTGVLAFFLAGVKESAWALPVLALLLHAVRRMPVLRAWPLWGGYATGIGCHLALRMVVIGGWLNAPGAHIDPEDNPLAALAGPARLLGGIRVVGLNLAHLVFPATLAPDYSGPQIDPTGGIGDPRLWAGIVYLLGAAALVVVGLRGKTPRARVFVLGGGWLLVSAFLLMNLVLTLGTILADRLLYTPSIAWVLVLAAIAASRGANGGAEPSPASGASPPRIRPWAVAGLLAILAAGYGVRSLAYLPAWKNDTTLFTAAIQASPRAPRVWLNYGTAMQEEGKIEEALTAYHRVEDLSPDYQEAWANEAAALMQQGRWKDAERPLARALVLNPQDTLALVNEGVAWMERGEIDRARVRFQEVLAGSPRSVEAIQNLALAEGRQGKSSEAAALWRRHLALEPNSSLALNNLAWLLATELGDPEEGVRLARRAVALAPQNANLHDTLAEALRRAGHPEEALAEAREALRLEPGEKYRRRLAEISAAPPR